MCRRESSLSRKQCRRGELACRRRVGVRPRHPGTVAAEVGATGDRTQMASRPVVQPSSNRFISLWSKPVPQYSSVSPVAWQRAMLPEVFEPIVTLLLLSWQIVIEVLTRCDGGLARIHNQCLLEKVTNNNPHFISEVRMGNLMSMFFPKAQAPAPLEQVAVEPTVVSCEYFNLLSCTALLLSNHHFIICVKCVKCVKIEITYSAL